MDNTEGDESPSFLCHRVQHGPPEFIGLSSLNRELTGKVFMCSGLCAKINNN